MLRRIDEAMNRRLGGHPLVTKLIRYSTASVFGVITSQAVLLFAFVVIGMDAVPANVVAVTAGAAPNYLVNRAWTWQKRGQHRLWAEVIPFWTMAFLGLVLSTFTVRWADQRFDGNVIALSLANIGAFGVLWVAKFMVLDRVLFAPVAAAATDTET